MHFLDPIIIIKTLGVVGVIAIIFAESGLFFGFFLPGDSLLFTAGFLASQGYLNITVLILGSFVAAVFGDSFGYVFGRRVGPKIFSREDSFFFHKKDLEKGRVFYEHYGAKTIILARFVPIVRTFAPIVAGVGEMPYRKFIIFNIIGGFIWTVGLSLGGFYLGSFLPGADRYLAPIIVFIVLVSFVPVLREVILTRRHRRGELLSRGDETGYNTPNERRQRRQGHKDDTTSLP